MTIAPVQQFANVISTTPTTLVGAINAGATSLQPSQTINFPSAYPFWISVQDSASASPDYLLVTGASGGSLTVVRGLQGTASSHINGAIIQHVLTAADIQAMYPSGTALTGSGSQTWDTAFAKLNFTATGASAITIDPTAMVPWRDYTLKDAGLNAATFSIELSPLTGTINDDAAYSNRTMTYNGQAISFYSDGVNLWVKS